MYELYIGMLIFQVAAISVQSSQKSGKVDNADKSSSGPLEWNSFDMHAVVASTEDLLKFILSDKGFRVRLFIVRDILKVADVFLEDQVTCMFDENRQPRYTVESEVDFIYHFGCSRIHCIFMQLFLVLLFLYICIFFSGGCYP